MFEIDEKRPESRKRAKMGHFLEAVWDRHYAKFVVICYWLLGMTNNFAYVIMLSAAHDILDDGQNKTNPSTKNTTNKYDCNELSTGTILLGKIINIKKKNSGDVGD